MATTTHSLTELLSVVKKENQNTTQVKQDHVLDKTVTALNALFEQYWTPLFDENKEYPVWNKGFKVYFGKNENDYFVIDETPINKIVLVNPGLSTRKSYPESRAKSYNKILYTLVKSHMTTDFFNELDKYQILIETGINRYLRSFDALIMQFKHITNVEEVNNENMLDINGHKIKVYPSLSFAKTNYYYVYNDIINDVRNYANEHDEMSELLYERLMKHLDNLSGMRETVHQLVQVYTDITNELLTNSDIYIIKQRFIAFCNKYRLNSEDYRVRVRTNVRNKIRLAVGIIPDDKGLTFEQYMRNNSNYSALKGKSESSFEFDFEDLEQDVKEFAVQKLQEELENNIYAHNKSSLEKLHNIDSMEAQHVVFGNAEITISKPYEYVHMIHNNWEFYQISDTEFAVTYDDYDVYKELLKTPYDEIKANLESSAKVIKQFLQS